VAAACKALGARRIGLISPYIADVSAALRQALTNCGLTVQSFASFNEKTEARVARIDPASILSAALRIGADPAVDVVFLSCTNLRTLDIIAQAEAKLGKPVISSNQALAWHMAALSGLPPLDAKYGRLMQHRL
jgi:maleate isomerase